MRLRRERKELCYNLKASCKMEPDCDTWSWKVWERCRDWSCVLPTTGSESFSSFRAAKRLLSLRPKKLILKILRQKTNTQSDPMIISFSAKSLPSLPAKHSLLSVQPDDWYPHPSQSLCSQNNTRKQNTTQLTGHLQSTSIMYCFLEQKATNSFASLYLVTKPKELKATGNRSRKYSCFNMFAVI